MAKFDPMIKKLELLVDSTISRLIINRDITEIVATRFNMVLCSRNAFQVDLLFVSKRSHGNILI